MIETDAFEKLEIENVLQLREWLEENYKKTESIWLVTYMKLTPEKYVSREGVLDELISFGWIDGVRRKLDSKRTMQLISPRRVHHWAKTYKDRATRLIKNGQMHPAGLASIEQSKKAGLWDEMTKVDALEIPKQLKTAFAKEPIAKEYFDHCPPSYRRNVLRWLHNAKKQDTKANRITKIVEACTNNERIPQM